MIVSNSITCFQKLVLTNILVSIISMIWRIFEQIFVHHLWRWKSTETLTEQQPTSFAIFFVVILPSLVGQLAIDLITKFLVLDAFVDDVVTQDLKYKSLANYQICLLFDMNYLFSHARKFIIVHKSENEFENGQRFVEIGFLVFGQERSFDRVSFHLPQVRFEIHIGHLLKLNHKNIQNQNNV